MICSLVFEQTTKNKYSKEVYPVDAIITAYYDVVSGSNT